MSSLRPCILHIGIIKTGTTSIQRTLKLNSDLLHQHGFYLPKNLGTYNHRLFGLLSLSEPELSREWIILSKIYPYLQRFSCIQEGLEFIENQFREEINAVPYSMKIIISSEQLSQRLHSFSDILELKQTLHRLSLLPSKIIVYLREQIGLSLSAESTRVLSGKTSRMSRLPLEQWNHQLLLERWQAVFGHDVLRVRTYYRDSLYKHDVISDFFVRGLELSPSISISRADTQYNPRLGRRGLRLLRLVNHLIPVWTKYGINPLRSRVAEVLSHKWITGRSDTFGQSDISYFEKYYADSNRWVDDQFDTHLCDSFGNT